VASLDANHLKVWQAVAAMTPKLQMLKYHDAFLKGYLELLLFCQQYGTIKVPKAIHKSLNEWFHNQQTLIGGYKNKKAGKGE
jgi:phage gp29-like protein